MTWPGVASVPMVGVYRGGRSVRTHLALRLAWRLSLGEWRSAPIPADPNPFPRIRLWRLR